MSAICWVSGYPVNQHYHGSNTFREHVRPPTEHGIQTDGSIRLDQLASQLSRGQQEDDAPHRLWKWDGMDQSARKGRVTDQTSMSMSPFFESRNSAYGPTGASSLSCRASSVSDLAVSEEEGGAPAASRLRRARAAARNAASTSRAHTPPAVAATVRATDSRGRAALVAADGGGGEEVGHAVALHTLYPAWACCVPHVPDSSR